MSEAEMARRRVDGYLQSLAAALRGLPPEQVRDIVAEIRSHVVETATAGGDLTLDAVESALAALGGPAELAGLYVTDDLLARAQVSRSPLLILHGLFRWASLSVAGALVLGASLVGYVAGASLVACALLKPLHPQTAGLWATATSERDLELSLRLGFGAVPAGGRELLGWWLVPIGLLAGLGLVLLTTQFGLWSIRHFRHARAFRDA